jgi:prophage regulatory protein
MTINNIDAAAEALIRLPQVKRLTGLARSSIYRRVQDRSFPAPVNLGGRAVAWVESEVQGWIQSRIEESREVVA